MKKTQSVVPNKGAEPDEEAAHVMGADEFYPENHVAK
jgi:hypothetical protein